jgi:predicted DNA-binding transcriptional regulator YafY
VIHPYYLKEFNNRWFLFGWSDLNKRIEIMALDRMVKISVTSGIYHPDCFDPDTYFAHLIGVTDPGTPVEKIQLCFAKDRAPYIITRRIHTSQVHAPCENGNVNIELDLKVNRELLALILAYGDDVEVLAPESLRLTIKVVHQRALEKYQVGKIA